MLKRLKKLRDLYLVNVKWRRYSIGVDFHAGARVRMWARSGIQIGNHFYIGRDSQIETDCRIGNYVLLGNKVAIVGKYDHHYRMVGTPTRLAMQIRDKDYNWKGLNQITIIKDDVWVGYGSILMSGVTLGEGCIVAAGSVVTKDVESYTIYGGNPANKIADRFESEQEREDHKRKLQTLETVKI